MTALGSLAANYLLNSLWQVPLIFAAAWMAVRMVKRTGPQAEHRIWVAALLLETVLPACPRSVGHLWRTALYLLPSLLDQTAPGGVKIAVASGHPYGTDIQLPSAVLSTCFVFLLCSLLYFSTRLAWGAWRTAQLRRRAQPLTTMPIAIAMWGRCCSAATSPDARDVPKLATSSLIQGPVTLGLWRTIVLLPTGFLAGLREDDLEAVLAHEFAHIRRRDFAKNLVYSVVALPIAWHPLLWLTRSRLAESREMICDAMAARAVAPRQTYTQSLLRLASMQSDRRPATTLHAIGIFDAHILERRIMNLTHKSIEIGSTRRALLAALCLAIGLATCASALALRFQVAAVAASPADRTKPPQIKNLTIVSRKAPIYPAEAKAKKDTLDGPVVLAVIVGKDGSAENIRVTKSLRADYDRSAIDAVRDWHWEPYLLNGEPVEVEASVTITYSLAH